MSAYLGKVDLRSMKTEMALSQALFSLLGSVSFSKVTVSEICEKALVSRATFYTHFVDKYELLKACLTSLKTNINNAEGSYDEIAERVNQFVSEERAMIKNILESADDETTGIVHEVIISSLNIETQKDTDGKMSSKYYVLANFYAGGILSYISWQVKNKFPADVPFANKHLYEIIKLLREWETSEESPVA